MIRKQFEQDLHDLYDEPAKTAIAGFLENELGIEVLPNPDKYGVDLLIMRKGKLLGVAEVEVRQWMVCCPFPTIHVPERKTKFFNGNSLFFALTKDMKHAYWIESKEILKHPLKEVRNVKVYAGEMFFDVPTYEFNYVRL